MAGDRVATDPVGTAVTRWTRAIYASLLAIVGAPNYERYLAHVHRTHPDARPLTRDEFCQRQLEGRYNRTGGRCC
jgi:uncharacterized short protein YbdD (DUF466 family)